MRILFIIVTYNAMKWVDRCLGSIQKSNLFSDVFIVDNGSTDGTQNYIQKKYPKVLFQQSTKNLGFGKANNLGLQYALDNDYDYVYLLNQDAWLMPETLKKLIAINKETPQYGILSPIQLQGNEQNIDVNFAKDVCSYKFNSSLINDLFFSRRGKVYEVPYVMAAHWLISSDCLKQVGGFSLTFPHYGEDLNYTDRVMYHGYKIGIVPGAIAIHDREFRKDSKAKRLHLVYMGALYKLSYIYNQDEHPFLFMILRMFDSAVKLKSLYPISYIVRILCNYRIIRHNIEISKGKCAFLTTK